MVSIRAPRRLARPPEQRSYSSWDLLKAGAGGWGIAPPPGRWSATRAPSMAWHRLRVRPGHQQRARVLARLVMRWEATGSWRHPRTRYSA